MPETPRPCRSGPPYNPGVREFVSGKRQWSSPSSQEEAKRGFRGWHERGYLPHRDERGLTQFATFHLADSFPATRRSEWEAMLLVEDDRARRRQLEDYLDRGRGECHLCQPEVATLVESVLRFRHGRDYELRIKSIVGPVSAGRSDGNGAHLSQAQRERLWKDAGRRAGTA